MSHTNVEMKIKRLDKIITRQDKHYKDKDKKTKTITKTTTNTKKRNDGDGDNDKKKDNEMTTS